MAGDRRVGFIRKQNVARRNYDLLKENFSHPSLHFKKVDKLGSLKAGPHHRAGAAVRLNPLPK